MQNIRSVNDCVIKFANVNGSGSASANGMFARAVFRMGVPVSPKNIFPSNIQGLPTWYEVRVSERGHLGRRGGVDLMVCMNPHSQVRDIAEILPGGYCVYDASKPLPSEAMREDVRMIGVPLMNMCIQEYHDPRQRQLFKNVIYIGALAALLDMGLDVFREVVGRQFKSKEKLIAPNMHALELGYDYARAHFDCPLGMRIAPRDLVGDAIMIDGNDALALGALYAGATVVAWYPITPSTSVVEAFERHAKALRVDADGHRNYAVVQAEDELAAIGMVIGANWNGARAFTATSGPGVSLMSEFLGLAYFAEVPLVLFDIQRAGPSTGMPTRTQQSDLLACAYASHGDTRHVLLFPSTPRECFELAAESFDLAESLQTPVILMSDLDLGMNAGMSAPLAWDDARRYRRGKVLDGEALEAMDARYGRYLDVDGDGICYRSLPGTHPTKGAYTTRGTSRDPYAVYTESGEAYTENMDRLSRKWETARAMAPAPRLECGDGQAESGMICIGSSREAVVEALSDLAERGVAVDMLRVLAFPFADAVGEFIAAHQRVFVVEQNRDAQLRQMLQTECGFGPERFVSILHYDGAPITAEVVRRGVLREASASARPPLAAVASQ